VCNEPQLLRELVAEAIADEFDIWCVAPTSWEVVKETCGRIAADFAIVTLDSDPKHSGMWERLLAEYRTMVILAVSWPSNKITVFSEAGGIQSVEIESSLTGVLDVLRSRAALMARLPACEIESKQ
jgi:hypothetical protein